MPTTSWKRKSYGPVKPVRKPKAPPRFKKPPVSQLRQIYSALAKAPSWHRLDLLVHATNWHREMILHLDCVKKRPFTLAESKLMIELSEGINPNKKEESRIKQIQIREKILHAHGFKVPLIGPYARKGAVAAKKQDKVKEEVTERYDKTLSLIAAALPNCKIKLSAVPRITDKATGEHKDFKYDHQKGEMTYSRSYLKIIKQRIHREGLLPVILKLAMYLAKAKIGMPSSSGYIYLEKYMEYLTGFCEFAATDPKAPTKLVRRTVPRIKRRRHLDAESKESNDKT